jgi:uridine kinase
MSRNDVLKSVALTVRSRMKSHPLRIGISGITSSGKTTLANELTEILQGMGINVIRALMDDFHNPKTIRYSQGRTSAKGYYDDAYDHNSLLEKLLKPLGPNGNGYYQIKSHDLASDQSIDLPPVKANRDSVLMIDGTFLFKSDIREELDFKIYVETDFEIALERGSKREKHALGGLENAKRIFLERYHPASKMYLEECNPDKYADLIVNNNDLDNPVVICKER